MRIALIAAALLCVLFAGSSPARAWELTMSGEYEYRFRWFGRTGNNDLFGNADVQEGAPGGVLVGMAGPNIYNTGALPTVPAPSSNFRWNLGNATGRQMLITRGGFSASGSDALYTDSRLTVRPTLRLNRAMRIDVVYNHGGIRNKYHQNAASSTNGIGVPPFERWYQSQTSMNATDTAGVVSVEQIRGTITTPIALFSIGTKNFPFGTGATFGTNTRSESFLIVVPYGPFRFFDAVRLGRSANVEAWATVPDGTGKYTLFHMPGFTFRQAGLDIGAAALITKFHGNHVAPFGNDRDDNTFVGIVYGKYNNGRLFLNAEYAWINVNRYRSIAPIDGSDPLGTHTQTIFIEGNHFFAEVGAFFGPLRLTIMYALASGPVLNNDNRVRNAYGGGFFLGPATPAPFTPGPNPKVYTPFPINHQAMQPYEHLMFTSYAGGNNGGWNVGDLTFVADEHGMATDMYCFGGRIDYGFASNLNIWGAYLWAHRLERAGTYFGQYQSSGSLAAGSIPNLTQFYNRAGRSFGTGNDYVSNGFIGWEANAGIDWKLLEGLTLRSRYSYWAPGDWFREAYQSVVFDETGSTITTGVLETRDPIHAFQGSLLMEF